MDREELQKLSLAEKKKLFHYLISDFVTDMTNPDPNTARQAKHTFLNYVMFFKNIESLLHSGEESAMTTLKLLAKKFEQHL